MEVRSDGSVRSFKIVSPKGLQLEKDPEVRKGLRTLQFAPARKDGAPVPVLIEIAISCPADAPSFSTVQTRPTH